MTTNLGRDLTIASAPIGIAQSPSGMDEADSTTTSLSTTIGMRTVGDGPVMRVPYAPELVGDPDTGVIHGGVITALLDSASGHAVRATVELGETNSIATLDLRIDYMRPARPGADLLAEADCHRVTRNVAFVRAVAYEETPDDPIATSVGTFMLGTRGAPRGGS